MPENKPKSGKGRGGRKPGPQPRNPGMWKPGQSGNPGGRPKTNREVVELARGASEIAIGTLVQLALKGPGSVRVQAAKALLDRGYGKPTQTIAVTGLDEQPDDLGTMLEEMTDEQLRAVAAGADQPARDSVSSAEEGPQDGGRGTGEGSPGEAASG